jgi:peroxiredoxin
LVIPPDQLADCMVSDLEGRRVRLGDEWRDRPAVVVWLRHFGCIFCKQQAAGFLAHQSEIEGAGARLVFVGNGEVRWARAFEAEHCPGCRILTDPGLTSYRAIGARRGWRTGVRPRVIAAGLSAFRQGFRQTAVRGVADQQGGVFVLFPGDRVAYAYLSGSAGDHPPIADVIAALRATPARAAAGGGARQP